MFIHFLPSFSSFFFLFPLVSLYFYIIFGRAKTLENRSFKIDTAGYKTIWSTDSLKIKKNGIVKEIHRIHKFSERVQRYTHLLPFFKHGLFSMK